MNGGFLYNYRGVFKTVRRIKESDDESEGTWKAKFHLACKEILAPYPSEFKAWFMGKVFPEWGLNDEYTKEELAREMRISKKQLEKIFKRLIKRLKQGLPHHPFMWLRLKEDARPKEYFERKKQQQNQRKKLGLQMA